MSRHPRPETKRTLAILADGKARSVDQIAQEAGIDAATAYEVIRSLTKQREVRVFATVTHYTISGAGQARATRVKEYDADSVARTERQRLAAIERTKKYVEKRRGAKASPLPKPPEPPPPKGPCMVTTAIANRRPIEAVWSAHA